MAYRSLVFLLLLFSLPAHSSVVVSPVVAGYSAAAGTYQGAAAAANGAYGTQAIINVGGRAGTAPAAMRFAANAGRYAVTATRLNPAGLAVGAIAAWLLPYGLQWLDGQWRHVVPASTNPTRTVYISLPACDPNWPGRGCTAYDSLGDACSHVNGGAGTTYSAGASDASYGYCVCSGSGCPYPGYQYPLTKTQSCVSNGSFTTSSCVVAAKNDPATDADFQAVPNVLPDAVADQMADSTPVPVSPPEFSPTDIPTGDPYKKPDGSTVQPRAKISPNPSSPGTVTVDTYEQPLTNPDGTPATNAAPVDTPDPPKDPCEDHPDRVGCADLGTPDSDVPKTQNNVFAYTPESAAFTGSCPAPLSVLGRSLSFQPACDAMSLIKPLILGLASLMAGYILIGAFRET